MNKSIICIVALVVLATSAFAGEDTVLTKGPKVVVDQATTGLTAGPHKGTLSHFIPFILDGPVKQLIPVTIHLNDGSVITGKAKYDEKTDRYDIRTIYAFVSEAPGKVKEEWVAGYVVGTDNALGFPAMNKGMWIRKPSLDDPDPTVTVFVIKATGNMETTGIAPVGAQKGTLLHWLPAGSGSPETLFGDTGPSPITIRLDDGSLAFGDAVYDEKTNCHDIRINSVVSFDNTEKPQRARVNGYVEWSAKKSGVSCPNDRGVYAAVARFTDKSITERDEVVVVFTPIQ